MKFQPDILEKQPDTHFIQAGLKSFILKSIESLGNCTDRGFSTSLHRVCHPEEPSDILNLLK